MPSDGEKARRRARQVPEPWTAERHCAELPSNGAMRKMPVRACALPVSALGCGRLQCAYARALGCLSFTTPAPPNMASSLTPRPVTHLLFDLGRLPTGCVDNPGGGAREGRRTPRAEGTGLLRAGTLAAARRPPNRTQSAASGIYAAPSGRLPVCRMRAREARSPETTPGGSRTPRPEPEGANPEISHAPGFFTRSRNFPTVPDFSTVPPVGLGVRDWEMALLWGG